MYIKTFYSIYIYIYILKEAKFVQEDVNENFNGI